MCRRLQYKPFSLKADIFKAADSVAQALAASFEVCHCWL
jgi:hypothetical protein